MIQTARIGLHFNTAPLTATATIAPSTSVGASQAYDADRGEHLPDYLLTPLMLRPLVQGSSEDAQIGASADLTSMLANCQWREMVDGAERDIPDSDTVGGLPMYEVDTSTWELTCRRNALPKHPVRLRFTAQVYDPALGQSHGVDVSVLVVAQSTSAARRLSVSAPRFTAYNPLGDPAKVKVRARYYVGQSEAAAPNVAFTWLVKEGETPQGVALWRAYGTDPLDYWMEITENGSLAEIDRERMGEGQALRIEVRYDEGGNPLGNPAEESFDFAIARQLPKLRIEPALAGGLAPGTTQAAPALLVSGPRQVYSDSGDREALLNKEVEVVWKIGSFGAAGAAPTAYSVAGYGLRPTLPLGSVTRTYGSQLRVEVNDRGPLKAWADSDGKILTDSDGKILLIK